ncbi:cellular nucleic acid-binding protein [Trifolium medium]|uniref:Cellular nucleic acid-binding protein n=1 Tax=Trifolium medium TaxID=97028 RepID=A0A392PQF9_9FABA|nr:cellular nucleic acid-binding protein [Trifolium medium]
MDIPDIRAMSVLSGPALGDYSCCMRMVGLSRVGEKYDASSVVDQCPVNFGNVDFELDLVWLPLSHMDVIFGMDWMLSFGVSINCLTKSVTFSKRVGQVGEKFLIAEQVKKSLDGEACMFMMFASLKEGEEKGVGDLSVVREFSF